jgi:hypothetical protein
MRAMFGTALILLSLITFEVYVHDFFDRIAAIEKRVAALEARK